MFKSLFNYSCFTKAVILFCNFISLTDRVPEVCLSLQKRSECPHRNSYTKYSAARLFLLRYRPIFKLAINASLFFLLICLTKGEILAARPSTPSSSPFSIYVWRSPFGLYCEWLFTDGLRCVGNSGSLYKINASIWGYSYRLSLSNLSN